MNGIWFNLYVGDIVPNGNGGLKKIACYVRSGHLRIEKLGFEIPKEVMERLEDKIHWELVSIDKHLRKQEWKRNTFSH